MTGLTGKRPNMRFVPIKSIEQQSRLFVHRARAKVLGIPKASLGNWVRQAAKGTLSGAGGDDKAAKVSPEQMEIARLRAEVARLRMERDIAKKAAAYFAQDTLRGTPCLLYTSPSPRDKRQSRMPSSA